MSFLPRNGATPDPSKVYGDFIMRGCFKSEDQARNRGLKLVKEQDSIYPCFIGEVGVELPLSTDQKYIIVDEVLEPKTENMNDEMERQTAERKLEYEQKRRNALKDLDAQREKLQMESKSTYDDKSIERYTELRVKLANTYNEIANTESKLKEVHEILDRTKAQVATLDTEFPTYDHDAIHVYEEGLQRVGLTLENTNIFKYLHAHKSK